VGEDGPGRVEIAAVTGQVVSRDPGQRPPPVVVVVVVDEIRVLLARSPVSLVYPITAVSALAAFHQLVLLH